LKLKRRDRLGIVLCTLINVIVLACVFAWAIAPNLAAEAGAFFDRCLSDNMLLQLCLAAVCVALAAFLLSRAWLLLHPQTGPKPLSLTMEEAGEVQISPTALEALVRRTVGQAEGVDRFDVRLANAGDALDVTLELGVKQGTKIPKLVQTAQKDVRRAMEEMAGVKVNNIAVLVTEIMPDTAQPARSGK